MSKDEWTIAFGKFVHEPGAPKNTPRWVWRCGCSKCDELFPRGVHVHGPFKTRRAAERDAEQFLTLYSSDRDNMGTA
jgi:hypothetical protein